VTEGLCPTIDRRDSARKESTDWLGERTAGDGRLWIRRKKKTTNLIGAIHPLLEQANSDIGR